MTVSVLSSVRARESRGLYRRGSPRATSPSIPLPRYSSGFETATPHIACPVPGTRSQLHVHIMRHTIHSHLHAQQLRTFHLHSHLHLHTFQTTHPNRSKASNHTFPIPLHPFPPTRHLPPPDESGIHLLLLPPTPRINLFFFFLLLFRKAIHSNVPCHLQLRIQRRRGGT